MFRFKITFLIAGLLTSCAGAAVVEYESKPAWQAAVGTWTTITFTEIPANNWLTNQYAAAGVLFDGTDFTTNAGAFIIDGLGAQDAGDDEIQINFLTPTFWIAVDHPGTVQFSLYQNGSLFYTSSLFDHGGVGFFSGVVSEQPFDQVIVSDPTGSIAIDDLHFGPPIPAPGALGILALAAMMAHARRRRSPT